MESGSEPVTAGHVVANFDPAEGAPSVIEEQANRPREEMSALYMGFGIAMLIGAFFLLYVVLAIGHIGQ